MHHRSGRLHPQLSSSCVCTTCLVRATGWLVAWYAVVARLAGVTVHACFQTSDGVLLAAAVTRLRIEGELAGR